MLLSALCVLLLAVRTLEDFSSWQFVKQQLGSGHGSGEVPPYLDKPGGCLSQGSKRAAMEVAVQWKELCLSDMLSLPSWCFHLPLPSTWVSGPSLVLYSASVQRLFVCTGCSASWALKKLLDAPAS